MLSARRALLAVVLQVVANHCSLAVFPILGSAKLDPSQAGTASVLFVTVHSHRGGLVESMAVTLTGAFALYTLPSQADGTYILHLTGVTVDEYHPLLVRLRAGAVTGTLSRANPLALPPREDSRVWADATEPTFVPVAKTNYEGKRASWLLTDLWRYKYSAVQLAAIVFVVWFPHFIRELPKDLREELMGEKAVDQGDPHALVKALTERRESRATPAVAQQ